MPLRSKLIRRMDGELVVFACAEVFQEGILVDVLKLDIKASAICLRSFQLLSVFVVEISSHSETKTRFFVEQSAQKISRKANRSPIKVKPLISVHHVERESYAMANDRFYELRVISTVE
jgi:hypothetical protein